MCVSWFSAKGEPVALPSAKHEVKQHRLSVRFHQLPRQGPVLNNNYTRPSALAETRGCYQLAWAGVKFWAALGILRNGNGAMEATPKTIVEPLQPLDRDPSYAFPPKDTTKQRRASLWGRGVAVQLEKRTIHTTRLVLVLLVGGVVVGVVDGVVVGVVVGALLLVVALLLGCWCCCWCCWCCC